MHRWLVVVAIALASFSAGAQREFVEEVRRTPGGDIDLDSDPAAGNTPLPSTTKNPPTSPTAPTKKPPATSPTAPSKIPGKPPVKGAPVVEPEPEPAPLPPPFVVVATDRAAFLEKIAPHFGAVQQGDLTRAHKALTGLERGALEAGVHGVPGGYAAPALGQALAREASTAVADGRSEEAGELLTLSLQVAPSDLASAVSRVAARLDLDGPIAAIGDLGDVVAAVNTHPVDRGVLSARFAVAAILAILAMLVAAVVVIAIPAIPTLAFDVKMALPRGAHVGQAVVVVIVVLVAPLLLGAGLVPSLLWMLLLTIAYVVRRTRIVVGVIAALAVALPVLVSVTARGWTAPTSSAALLAEALYDVDGTGAVQALRAREAGGGTLDVLGQVALANADRREGRVDDALTRYRALVQRHGDISWIHGGYGVALATAGEDDLALAELGLAAERARGEPGANTVVVTAAFDASLLHHKANRTDKAQSLLAPVADGNSELVAALRRATFRAIDESVLHNRAFIEVLPPRQVLFALESSPSSASVEAAFASVLWRSLPTTSATIVLAVLLFAMGVASSLATRFKLARPCVRCGEPASRRVDGPDVPHDTCAACYHAFISTKSRIDAGVKLRKENAIRRRNRRRGTTAIALSVLPGVGHLYVGAVARGLVLLLIASVAAAVAVVVSPWWPGPRAAVNVVGWIGVVPSLIVFALTLIVGVRSAIGVAEAERSAR